MVHIHQFLTQTYPCRNIDKQKKSKFFSRDNYMYTEQTGAPSGKDVPEEWNFLGDIPEDTTQLRVVLQGLGNEITPLKVQLGAHRDLLGTFQTLTGYKTNPFFRNEALPGVPEGSDIKQTETQTSRMQLEQLLLVADRKLGPTRYHAYDVVLCSYQRLRLDDGTIRAVCWERVVCPEFPHPLDSNRYSHPEPRKRTAVMHTVPSAGPILQLLLFLLVSMLSQ